MTGGRRLVLVTRPEADATRTVADLAARGIEALAWPLTRIVETDRPVGLPAETDAILFTSTNAVRAFAARSARRDLPALCVGDRTAGVARQAGFEKVSSAGGDVEALAALARAHGGKRMYHPRGRESAGDLVRDLAAAGIAVESAVLYAAEELDGMPAAVERALAAGEVAVLTAWSPRGARILVRRLAERPGLALDGVAAVAISRRAAEPLAEAGFTEPAIALRPDGPAMIDAIAGSLDGLRR